MNKKYSVIEFKSVEIAVVCTK